MPAKRQIELKQIVDAAVALIDSEGEAALTLGAVAGRLGVKSPSLYHHVDGLAGLRRAMALWGLRLMSDAIRRACVGLARAEALEAFAYAYREVAMKHPGVYRMLQTSEGADDEEMLAAKSDFVQVAVAVVTPFSTTQEDALHNIRAARSMLHGFVDLEASGGFRMDLDLDETFRRLVAVMIAGIENQTGG
jgi:AcrR family transcriptional regulator